MYNAVQLTYIIVSLSLTVIILWASSFIKNDKHKNTFLKFWALATFLIHISIMWVDYLKYGSATAPDSVLFPIYFCNASMYLLMVVAFIKNKKSKLFYYLATFAAYAGIFGALITVFEIHYFAGPNPQLTWGNLKSMLSHSSMLIGCAYLFVGKFVKIRVSNIVPLVIGLLGAGLLGVAVNTLFVINGLPNPNSMYLVESALEGTTLFTGYFLAAVLVALVLVFTIIWEQFTHKKGGRWYNNLKFKKKL